jgi:hypothetical protein
MRYLSGFHPWRLFEKPDAFMRDCIERKGEDGQYFDDYVARLLRFHRLRWRLRFLTRFARACREWLRAKWAAHVVPRWQRLRARMNVFAGPDPQDIPLEPLKEPVDKPQDLR